MERDGIVTGTETCAEMSADAAHFHQRARPEASESEGAAVRLISAREQEDRIGGIFL